MTDLTKININKLSISIFYDARSRSSFCWKYFGNLIYYEGHKRKILFPEQVYCSACLDAVQAECKQVNFGSVTVKKYLKTVSTGNLTRHLREVHQIREEEGRRKKISDDEGKPAGRSSSRDSDSAVYDKWLLARDVVLWFCRSLLPFNTLFDEGMTDFFQNYKMTATRENLPSQLVVNRALSDIYEDMLCNVQEKISVDGTQTFAMAFDLWTDQYRRLTYITFTLHYLTCDFDLKTLTLSTKIIGGRESGDKIKDAIADIQKQFGLENKIIHAITNADGNVRRAVLLSNMDHHLCLGHGLHNLVNIDGINAVPEVASVVKKCKNIIMALRYRTSYLEADTKKEQQELLSSIDRLAEMLEADENDPITQEGNLSIKSEKQEYEDSNIMTSTSKIDMSAVRMETPTRWHCILEMIEILNNISVRDILDNILEKNGQCLLRLTLNEWSILDDLVNLLRRFREVVEILSTQNTCTLNVGLVFRSEIIDILNTATDEESLLMFRLKRSMIANIDKRLPVTKAMVAAALLDYRFISLNEVNSYLKAHGLNRASLLANCVKEFIKVDDIIMIKLEEDDPLASNSKDAPSILQKLSRKHSLGSSQGIQDDPVEQECWRYLASADPTEPKDGNLFAFWNSKKVAFPWLSAFARKLLCVPATSTPSERVFSEAGLMLSSKKLRLNPATLNKIIFIHDNYSTCYPSKE